MNYKLKDIFKKPDIKMIAIIGIMIALEIVLHRFISIQTPTVQIHFGFIPIVFVAIFYGPLYAGLAWAIADVLGVLIFPTGALFFGFTITAFLSGIIFGMFLYKSKSNIVNTIIAVLIINLFFTLLLDMFWIYLITGRGFMILLPERIVKCLVMIPIQIISVVLIKKNSYRIKKTPS